MTKIPAYLSLNVGDFFFVVTFMKVGKNIEKTAKPGAKSALRFPYLMALGRQKSCEKKNDGSSLMNNNLLKHDAISGSNKECQSVPSCCSFFLFFFFFNIAPSGYDYLRLRS